MRVMWEYFRTNERVRWEYFRLNEFNNKWGNISPTTSSTTHPRLQIVIDSLRGDGIDPEELLARSCLVKMFKIYLSTLVWGWHDSSSALNTSARFSRPWQLKQGRISFLIFILFFVIVFIKWRAHHPWLEIDPHVLNSNREETKLEERRFVKNKFPPQYQHFHSSIDWKTLSSI